MTLHLQHFGLLMQPRCSGPSTRSWSKHVVGRGPLPRSRTNSRRCPRTARDRQGGPLAHRCGRRLQCAQRNLAFIHLNILNREARRFDGLGQRADLRIEPVGVCATDEKTLVAYRTLTPTSAAHWRDTRRKCDNALATAVSLCPVLLTISLRVIPWLT
jgi:hypothetical protein